MVIDRKEASPREGFARAVLESAAKDGRIVVLGADVTGSLHLDTFAQQYPDRFISLGIAEQNIASVAAGLAMSGYLPIMATYASFCTTRALDQIRISICYNRLRVIIAGTNAGVTGGPDGGTHQALEDIAVMRSLPHMTVASPSDAVVAYRITKRLLGNPGPGPVYIRLSRMEVPYELDLGEGYPVYRCYGPKKSSRIIITTGPLYWIARRAVDRLARSCRPALAIDLILIKSRNRFFGLDINTPDEWSRCTILTVEEHQVGGGMGSALLEAFAQAGCAPRVITMGVRNAFGISAPPQQALIQHELGEDAMYSAMMQLT